MENTIPKSEIETFVLKIIESRLQQAMEEFVQKNEVRIKELSLIERVVRVEEELKSLREMSEVKFNAIQQIMNERFGAMDKRFEAVDKRFEVMDKRFEVMDKRFEAMDKRFETMDKRFEALQREMNARFEAMNKRFSTIQWMIGLMVGIPFLTIAILQLVKIL